MTTSTKKQQTEAAPSADFERALQRCQASLTAAQGRLRETEAEVEAGEVAYMQSARDEESYAMFVTRPKAKRDRAELDVRAFAHDVEVAERALADAREQEHQAELARLLEPARYSTQLAPLLRAFSPRVVDVLRELGEIDGEVRKLVDVHARAVQAYRQAGGADIDALPRTYSQARAEVAVGCGNRNPADGRLELLTDTRLTEEELAAQEKAQAEAFAMLEREDTRASREAAERRANEEERLANLQAQRDAEARRLQDEHDEKASASQARDDQRSYDRRLGLASE